MSFGFSTPPNLGLFFGGLVSFVFGIILMIFYGSKTNLSRDKSEKPKAIPKVVPKHVDSKPKKGPIESIGTNIKPAAKPVKPKLNQNPNLSLSIKQNLLNQHPEKPVKKISPVTSRPVPKKVSKQPSEDSSENEKKLKTSKPPEFSKEKPEKIVPVSKGPISEPAKSKEAVSTKTRLVAGPDHLIVLKNMPVPKAQAGPPAAVATQPVSGQWENVGGQYQLIFQGAGKAEEMKVQIEGARMTITGEGLPMSFMRDN